MQFFYLPDLAEGLLDAEIHEWFVKVGDHVQEDQPLVSMETAKAVVDVPSPQSGVIAELFGKAGDVIKTGAPLVRFEVEAAAATSSSTVVGQLEESTKQHTDTFTIGAPQTAHIRILATPRVRLLAKQRKVDLSTLQGTGEGGVITAEDVERAAPSTGGHSHGAEVKTPQTATLPEGFEALHGVRRNMLQSMVMAHAAVVPVTLYDEVDIDAWLPKTDVTLRLIRAVVFACTVEPALNAWFDGSMAARRCFSDVNLGLALDSEVGLLVPVLHDVAKQSDSDIRACIEDFKTRAAARRFTPDQLKGATIVLSNFGKFAGRFASPIVVPPTVAILGVGRLYPSVVAVDEKIVTHRMLPLSLSFDHRAVTGGEATRFLGAVMQSLQGQTA